MSWPTSRPAGKSYTAAGITRLKCIRCGAKARHEWSICADGNRPRPVCLDCDIELNRMVLTWANDPDATAKADRYEAEQRAKYR